MRKALVNLAASHPALFRAALSVSAPILPNKWLMAEIVGKCGGYYSKRAKLGNGMAVHVFLGDVVGYHISEIGWYEPEMVKLVRSVLTNDTVFFDVGAHVGQYSLMASEICQTVHAFEANPKTFKLLTDNIHANHLSNVRPAHLAICAEPGTVTFHESNHGNTGGSSLYGDGPEVTVDATTLDVYCHTLSLSDALGLLNAPVVIKIDVEGAELSVLRGAADVLSRPNVTIFMEARDEHQRLAGTSKSELLNYLRDLGYSITDIDESNIKAVSGECVLHR